MNYAKNTGQIHVFSVHNYLEHFFSLSMQFVDERSINFLQLILTGRCANGTYPMGWLRCP